MRKLITSESVSRGHPDKICDQISDAILDDLLKQDKNSRVAVETLVTRGSVMIAGEVTTNGFCDVQNIARRVLKDIGYTNPKFGIDWEDAGVWPSIHSQSLDISRGVTATTDRQQGAGDQGMMYGYACRETSELMPLPIMMAHSLVRKLEEARKRNVIPYLGPDGKSQVTIEYENGKPIRLDTIVIAQQHTDDIPEELVKEMIQKEVIYPICKTFGFPVDENTKIYVNATGRFVIGGPEGDTGLTGRKIMVDTYGGVGRHGGGAFSGKDPSKVDRSGAYMARYIAKNIVASGLADKCEIQLAYAIGVAKPVSVYVDTFGTSAKVTNDEIIANFVKQEFDLRPRAIIEQLDLLKPKYEQTACYGHFGRNEGGFTWEKTDRIKSLSNKIL